MLAEAFDVVIVGAGLAGATAATELREHGLRVAILEARDRVGGRGYARPFAGGDELVEFGGAWITPWQHRIRRLCAEQGIELRPRAPIGERRWFRDGALHRDGPSSTGDRLAHERAVARIAADAILLKQGHERDEKGRDIAGVSFADYLGRLAPPRATRELLSAWWCLSGNADKRLAPATELLSSSAYGEGLTEAMADVWADTLVGGVAELTGRMLRAAGVEIRLGTAVRSIATSDLGIAVRTESGASIAGRAAVLATGINPLRNIRFDPPLPGAKAEAVATGHLGRAVKIWAKVRGVKPGVLATGGGTGIEWMFSERGAADGATMLVGFGVAANGWAPDMPRDAEAAVVRFFPEAEFLASDWHDWNADPYSLGAWAAAKVGAEAATARRTWCRHGPLAFATSDFAEEQAGWFEAAVISGEAAAREILQFLGRA